MMDWHPYLEKGEELRWCGRPAPRCYTFRHWPHTLFGVLLLPISLVWLDGGQSLADSRGEAVWGVLPWLGVAVAAYFLCGHLLLARIVWEGVFYAITDRRVLAVGGWPVRRSRSLHLDQLRHLKLRPRGRALGSVLVTGDCPEERLSLVCLEHPDKAVSLLEAAIVENLARVAPQHE